MPMTTGRALRLGSLATAVSAVASAAPEPLVELLLNGNLRNTGSLAGEASFEEYAPGEGPRFVPGLRGAGVSFLASSRGGGTGHSAAGGAVAFPGDRLAGLAQVTLTLWFMPVGPNGPARLVYFSNDWDLFVFGECIGFKVRNQTRDHARHTPKGENVAVQKRWNFVAVTFDRATGKADCYHGLEDGEFRHVSVWEGIPAPDASSGSVQIGNLGSIRPFHGVVDSFRAFDRILSATEVRAVFEAGASGPRPGLRERVGSVRPREPVFGFGDVCLSSRGKRPTSIETIRAFRANRLMWAYPADSEFIAACKQAGCETYQGAINSIPGTDETAAHALDLDGKPVVAPWMVAFNREKPWYWGCNNRPRFMELSLARAVKLLDAGAAWIQFDDWALVVSAAGWGGACFCDDCMAAFRSYLGQQVSEEKRGELGLEDTRQFDYRTYLAERHGVNDAQAYKARRRSLPATALFEDFQRKSVRAFFADLRKRINAEAGRVVPLSINSTFYRPSQRSNYIPDLVDFLQGETWEMGLVDLALAAKTAEGLGRWQVFVPKPRDLQVARRAIAASYALGQLMLVPWDMYMGSDATGIRPRYYGTVEQYGDLFHFVRDRPRLFDACESVATAGVIVDLDRYSQARVAGVCRRLFEAQMPFTFLPVGHRYYTATLAGAALRGFDVLLMLDPPDSYAPEDREAIEDAAADVAVLPADGTSLSDLAAMSPFEVWGPRGLYIVPRATRDAGDRRLICHVLNRVEQDGTGGLKWVSFLVRRHALGDQRVTGARWFAPGEEPTDVEFEELAQGTRLIIPKLGVWGIAELTLE